MISTQTLFKYLLIVIITFSIVNKWSLYDKKYLKWQYTVRNLTQGECEYPWFSLNERKPDRRLKCANAHLRVLTIYSKILIFKIGLKLPNVVDWSISCAKSIVRSPLYVSLTVKWVDWYEAYIKWNVPEVLFTCENRSNGICGGRNVWCLYHEGTKHFHLGRLKFWVVIY